MDDTQQARHVWHSVPAMAAGLRRSAGFYDRHGRWRGIRDPSRHRAATLRRVLQAG